MGGTARDGSAVSPGVLWELGSDQLCLLHHVTGLLRTWYLAAAEVRDPLHDVCWLLNVPATCECISGTDLL